MVQYETVFGLWLPYRGGGAFQTSDSAAEWIEAEIKRVEAELQTSLGTPRKPFD